MDKLQFSVLIFVEFNFTPGAGDQQISSKSVERLQRYGDLTVFTMAAV